MRRIYATCVTLVAALQPAAWADLQVTILEAPLVVSSYEPVFVLFEVRNTGTKPLLVPQWGCRGQGTTIEIGPQGESLADPCGVFDLKVSEFAWILPGQRRLFLDDAALGSKGLFEIRAVVRSSGLCIGSLVGTERRPLPPIREVEGVGRRFDCWEGEAQSEPILVNVLVPSDPVDLEAAEFLQLEKAGNWKAKLILSHKELIERFSSSHYTYAASYAGGGAYSAISGIQRKPDNPLNRYAAVAAAAAVAGRTRRCASRSSEPFWDPERDRKWVREILASYPPSEVGSAYLAQLTRDHEAEECPGASAPSPPHATGGSSSSESGHGETDGSEPGASSRRSRRQASNELWGGAFSSATPRSAGGAFPSTMGFKQRLILSATPGPTTHWLSLPYRYEPEDVGTIGVVDAEDLCQDVGDGGGVTAVLCWNEATSTIVEHACGNPSPFGLQAGQAYGIRRTPNWSLSANLAGGHDDALSFSIPASGASQLSWVSVPYHLRNPSNHDPVTAGGLCQQISSAELLAIVRYDSAAGLYRSYGCGSAFELPFQVDAGEGLGLVNRGSQTISWQPLHY